LLFTDYTNVKEGSVIEIEYTISSDFFFNLRDWAFQSTIPVMYSEYLVHIPEYYTFNQKSKGYFPFKTEKDVLRKEISITTVTDGLTHHRTTSIHSKDSHTSKIVYQDNTYHYLAQKVPAFPGEEFLRTADNYITKIGFELQKMYFPGSAARSFSTSWSRVDEILKNSDSFGKSLVRSGHLENVGMHLKSTGVNGLSLMNLAFNHIQQKIVWNGNNSTFINQPLAKAYKDGSGNSSEVNLNLVALMRDLDFEAYPVVLSTQKHGIIHPAHPSLSSFNYVIAMVRLENETYLMDATDPYGEINLLPIRCLNDKGMVIGSSSEEWITLMDYRPYHFVSDYTISLSDDLLLSGSRRLRLKDYASYQYKKQIKSYADLSEYAESLDEQDQELSIANVQVEGVDSTGSDLILTYEFYHENYVEDAVDLIYLPAVFDPYFDSNPFKLEKREYPVEFNHPYTLKQNFFISLPEDYTLSELPEPLVIKMPDKSAQYLFQVVKSGNGLFITTQLSVRKSQFLPEEYESLKQFYQVVIDKQNELIVLNKS